MAIISHAIRDHQGIASETNMAAGAIPSAAVIVSQLPPETTPANVVASTAGSGAPLVLTAVETGNIYTNTGAGAEAYFTLPAATTLGVTYTFVVTVAAGIRVVAVGTDTIQLNAAVSAAAGYYESLTVGTCVTLVCIATGKWYAISLLGTAAVT